MNRRNFLKSLSSIGLVAAASPVLGSIPEFKEYPKFTYNRDWVIEKRAFLHTVHAGRGNNIWSSHFYSDEQELPGDILEDMFLQVHKALDK
jgi:hypothetical protein